MNFEGWKPGSEDDEGMGDTMTFRVGDVVRLRCAGTATLTKITPEFVHSGEDGWFPDGSFYGDGVQSLFDIVEIIKAGSADP